jgi:hypothetical protein
VLSPRVVAFQRNAVQRKIQKLQISAENLGSRETGIREKSAIVEFFD